MNNAKDKELILGNLVLAMNTLERCPEFALLIPEVRVNLVYALPDARSRQDVAAIDGRITAIRGMPRASGYPAFGGSDHMARLILEVRKYDPAVNAGINFKCDSSIIEIAKKYCADHQWLFGWIDRTQEPTEVIQQDGASMPWKIKQLVASSQGVPRLFYEGDGWGKEPLFVALGKDAREVVQIATDIAKSYSEKIPAPKT